MDMSLLLGLAGALILVVLFLMFRVQGLLSILRGSDKEPGGTFNKFNAALFLIVGVIGMFAFVYYSITEFDNYTLPVASDHGVRTDNLFWVTTVIISIVFILTNMLLFVFAYKYQYKKGNIAKFFPDHHVLELVWTVIPAIVLTYLVFNGYQEWTRITDTPPAQLVEDKVELEVVGQQFYWNVRYPGADKELGEHYFRNIDADNSFGLKVMDNESWDDFMPTKIVIPKDRKIHLIIRAKDVLHSVYLPHFRVKMDALPGMPTDFWFTATKTTEEMRVELNNYDFVYEMACAEMCGKGHYTMRYEVEVLENEAYEKWLAEKEKNSWALKNGSYVLGKLYEQGAPNEKMLSFLDFLSSKDSKLAIGAIDDLLQSIKENSLLDKEERNTKIKSLSSLFSSFDFNGNIVPGAHDGSSNPPLLYNGVNVDSLSKFQLDSLGLNLDSMKLTDTGVDALSESADEDRKGKFKNILHKAGDIVEGHRENKAERKGEDYEVKDNKLHKLGDKVEVKK